jgi:2-polyprenyl-6-methoxyphenol hydroxylase-like FAD-dependent oxidoreductase
VDRTTCIVVGGGPAGALLALMLAREGVAVTVLERAADFDRSFRGNTLNPAALHLLDGLGLLEAVLALPHARTTHFTAVDDRGSVRFADFGALPGRFPFVALVQQTDVLPVLLAAASAERDFRLEMGAEVTGLLEEDGQVQGVEYLREGIRQRLRAEIVVACDGRASAVRRLGGLVPRDLGAPIDVLWLTLPRCPRDPDDAGAHFRFGPGGMVALMDAGTHWQLGAIIRKNSFPEVQARGLEAFRADLAQTVPALADRTGAVTSWDDLALLRVRVDRLRRWHRPGLLALGDAAHAMSPVGMVGINLALLDAAAAAEALAPPLRASRLTEAHLAEVQRQRERSTRQVQALQALAHRFVLGPALRGEVRLPAPVRATMGFGPAVRVATRIIAYGKVV